MARVRTGPRGHELLDRSIGEAAARIDGLSALGRLSALRVPGIDGAAVAVGAGPIERRQATTDELAAVAARDSRPPVLPVRAKAAPAAPAPQCPHVWGPRTGAGRMHALAIAEGWVEVVCVRCGADYDAPPAPAAPHPEEEPMPTPAAPPVIPCGTCLHEPVCRLKSELPADVTSYARQVIAPGLWLVSADYRVECDHYLGEPPAAVPLANRRVVAASVDAASHARWKASRVTDEAIVDALRTAGGNRNRAAIAVELSHTELRRRVGVMQAEGTLPAEIEAMLTSKPGTRKAVAS